MASSSSALNNNAQSTTNYGAMASTAAETKEKDASSPLPFIIIGPIATLLVGFAIAWGIYYLVGASAADTKIAGVGDLKWGFASVVVLGLTVRYINFIPLIWKAKALGDVEKKHNSNPFVYKEVKDGETTGSPMVIFETEGAAGSYNRANRSLQHMGENIAPLVAAMYMSSTIFPFPTFILVLLFGIGRIMHSVGYATVGYGGHAMGFLLSMLATAIVEGLCLIVAIKA